MDNNILSEVFGIEQSDSFNINQALAGTNPRFKHREQYRHNCQRCVATYEFRRRGFDLVAQPKPPPNVEDRILYGTEVFIKKTKSLIKRTGRKVNMTSKLSQQKLSKILKKAPDNSRHIVYVSWKEAKSAHVFIAEKINGAIHFLDPQNAERNVDWYFDAAVENRFGIAQIDNTQITKERLMIERVAEVNKNDYLQKK